MGKVLNLEFEKGELSLETLRFGNRKGCCFWFAEMEEGWRKY